MEHHARVEVEQAGVGEELVASDGERVEPGGAVVNVGLWVPGPKRDGALGGEDALRNRTEPARRSRTGRSERGEEQRNKREVEAGISGRPFPWLYRSLSG